MTKNLYYCLFFLASTFFLTSCLEDQCTDTISYKRFDPIYMSPSQFRVDIVTESLKALENPGKIYYYNDHLFINEMGEGVHIFDNSDKSNPEFITFYNIPGNFDIVIKDDIMLADNVIDLISIDISDLLNPTIIDRKEDYRDRYTWVETEDYVYYAYSIASPAVEIVDCTDNNFNRNQFWRGGVFLANNFENDVFTTDAVGSGSVGTGGVGIGGSTARFTVVGDYFYAIDNSSLVAYEFLSGQAPSYSNSSNLGWGIETIFPYKSNLFIGSVAGMHIYSLDNPAAPSKVSTFEHARACDPVVVTDDIAYVTLRDGQTCEGFVNQLDIIDISNLSNPTLIKSHSMRNPHGLSIDGSTLYLSEGQFGLKVLDVSNSNNINELAWDKNFNSKDVIYLGNDHLMSIGEDGFFQYDVSDPKNIREISRIEIQ